MSNGFWCKKGKIRIKDSLSRFIRTYRIFVDVEDSKKAKTWLKERGIEVRDEFNKGTEEPIVVPNQAHTMIYFGDPDGNRLELITRLPKEIDQSEKMYLSKWEELYL